MEIVQQYCYSLPGGEDIYLFTLTNDAGTSVSITNFGATITAFNIVMRNGEQNDIVLGFNNVEDYSSEVYIEQYPWFGCAVGRYANRIKNAAFDLEGKKISLTKNNGNNQLHGGKQGFDRKPWKVVEFGKLPDPFLELSYFSPDGEEGFPGNLDVVIRFELNNKNELSYRYTAKSDQPTPVNLTHHTYFNLDDGKDKIDDHEVKIYSSKILNQDKDHVATGVIDPVDNSVYDLREFQTIGRGHAEIGEYDKSYVVDHYDHTLRLVAEARLLNQRITLKIYSTESILHFYSGKWIPGVKGKKKTPYGPFSGFCMETHNYTNAVNIPHFPCTILRPGEKYYHKTVYKVTEGI